MREGNPPSGEGSPIAIDFNDDARGRELRLLVERAKYERWLQGETEKLLEREWNRVVDVMLSGKFREMTQFQKSRILDLAREIDRILKSGYVDVANLHLKEMRGYATLEGDVARAIVSAPLAESGLSIRLGPSLPKTYLASIAKLPIQGRNIGDWFEIQAQSMSLEARRIIQQGLIEGKAPAVISRRLLADARTPGPVLSRRSIRDARLISRTTVNAVQNDAAMASFGALPESVSDSYRLVVTFDSRTSVICAALADKVYRYDDPSRRVPPFHLNCRTGVQAIMKGIATGIGEQKTKPMNFRSYDAWLDGQTATVQNEILGAGRADLWRSGKLNLADAIDQDNRVLTLKQLRERIGLGEMAGAGAGQ